MYVKKHLSITILISIFLCAIAPCDAYRILGVFPMPRPSHYFLGNRLMKGLAEAGHDVTIIAPFKDQEPPANGTWREIYLSEHLKFIEDTSKHFKVRSMLFQMNPFRAIMLMNELMVNLTVRTITHSDVQKLINSGEKFDAVIVSEFWEDALKALANKFDAHLIGFSNHGAINWYFHNVGNIIPPSCYPEVLTSLPQQMNFLQRVQNTLFNLFLRLWQEFVSYPTHNEVVKKYLPGSPEISEILQNVSLVLVNSHISLNTAQPKVPVMVDIGGFHVKPPKQLPEDLLQLLDNAKNGVIYFSIGSRIKSEDLPQDKIDAILKAFSKRKEIVLWKWGHDTLPNKPNNVHIGKWFPQQDILAHPNVKLFVTHSGFLSITETIYNGVPIVSIPMMADQKINALEAAHSGYGVNIFVEDLSEEVLSRAIEKVITNPNYRKAAKEKSKLFHDRKNSPIEDAIYWVEYVIRHNGAKHLRVPYLNLKWYQYYLLDVIGFSFICLFIVIYILKKLFGFLTRFLIRNIFSRKSKLKTS